MKKLIRDKEKGIPDFADEPDSISIAEHSLYQEDDGIYVDCCHCAGLGYVYGDTGLLCSECDGIGVNGMR